MTYNLTDLHLEVYDIEDDHHEIGVSALWAWFEDEQQRTELFGPFDLARFNAAMHVVAGRLARLGIAAYPWLMESAQSHHCRPRWEPANVAEHREVPSAMTTGCGLVGYVVSLNDSGVGVPEIFFNVPTRSKRTWLTRIEQWLHIIQQD